MDLWHTLKKNPDGFKIGNLYFKYSIKRNDEKKNGNKDWVITESFSKDVLPGYLILEPSDKQTAFQYVRIRVYGMVNLNTGASANWADGILELAAFGKWIVS